PKTKTPREIHTGLKTRIHPQASIHLTYSSMNPTYSGIGIICSLSPFPFLYGSIAFVDDDILTFRNLACALKLWNSLPS
ncbi:MAG: hypothetical protein J4F29_25945, partial [Candidatus Latescibacteria bacterium]|nr:hypothetical protein [Candidatus Latescibacterota bacterium]